MCLTLALCFSLGRSVFSCHSEVFFCSLDQTTLFPPLAFACIPLRVFRCVRIWLPLYSRKFLTESSLAPCLGFSAAGRRGADLTSGHFITLKTCWLTRYSLIALSKPRDFFTSFEPYAVSMGLFFVFFLFPLKVTSCCFHTSILVCLQIWEVYFTVGNSKYKANRFQAFLPSSCEFHVSFSPEMLSEVFGTHPYSLQWIDLPINFQVTFHHLSEALPPGHARPS